MSGSIGDSDHRACILATRNIDAAGAACSGRVAFRKGPRSRSFYEGRSAVNVTGPAAEISLA